MNKHNQHGFSPLIVVIFIAVTAFVGFAGYKVISDKGEQHGTDNNSPRNSSQNQSASQSASDTSQRDETQPQLQNIGISFDDILYDKYAVSEFATKGMKGFYVFGDALPGNRVNPNFEFSSVKSDAKIISAIDGVVVNIKEQQENGTIDSEVFIQPSENSAWIIGYDHLINVGVKNGDRVKAGALLGNPNVQNNGLARFEIQVNKMTSDGDIHYCPSSLLATSVKDGIASNIIAMMQTWELTTGLELYNPDAQDPIGCRMPTLTPKEAEGV